MSAHGIGLVDLLEVALCIAAMFFFAMRRVPGGTATTEDFFLASRRIPLWAACVAFVATETSALTIIGVPAVAFRENWNYAQFSIGSSMARVVIAFLFIPAFYRRRFTTIYGFLRARFGPATQYAASVLFFLTRLLASGVRLMAACVAVSVFLGTPILPSILLFTSASLAYTAFGGVRAVVRANVVQALVFIAAGLSSLGYLVGHIPGGAAGAFKIADAAGRMEVFHWGPGPAIAKACGALADPNILWIAILNGFFGSLAAFGTDHEMMQRLLTLETRRESQKTILISIAASFLVMILFLAVGSGLFSFYRGHPSFSLPGRLDAIYPHFAMTVLPPYLRGLVLSAVVLASIDLPLSSLCAVFVSDIYRPLIRKEADERHLMRVSRVGTGVFAALLAAIAYFFSFADKMLWLAFKIGGVTLGSLLGVYLLGLMTNKKSDKANVWAMAAMSGLNAWLLYGIEIKRDVCLGWSWLIVFGTLGTFAIAWLLAPYLDAPRHRADRGAAPL